MKDAPAGMLRLSVERDEQCAIVHAEGEVDLDNAAKLSNAIRHAAESGGAVVVDLLGVPFMDSSGLKALLIGSAELGDRLSLVLSPGAPVVRLLELAELRDRFRIFAAVDAAREAV